MNRDANQPDDQKNCVLDHPLNSPRLPALLLLLTTALLTWSAHAAAAPDDWPRYARDPRLTSHSPLQGNITNPHLAWSVSLAGHELTIEVLPGSTNHPLLLNSAAAPAEIFPSSIAPPGPPLRDLDGTGTLRPLTESYHQRWADILTNVAGWEQVAWSHTWTDQKICRLQLFAHDEGLDKPRLLWQSDPPEDNIFQPLNIIHDIDHDGIQEVCVAAHYRVMIFEGTTGRKESELRYHQSRPYGWFGIHDVDRDGQEELITIGDFQSHIDVLNYDPSQPENERLSVRWRRDLEQNIEERKKWPHIGPEPVLDVTGEPGLELVLSIYNDTGDGQWHTVVLSAATGEMLHDFSSRYLQGAADIDHDGRAELFLIQTDQVFIPQLATIELIKPGENRVLWHQNNAAWATANRPHLDPHWSTTASQGMTDLLTNTNDQGDQVFAAWNHTATTGYALTSWQIDQAGHATSLWQVQQLPKLPDILSLGKPGHPGAQLRLELPADQPFTLLASNATTCLVQRRPIGVTLAPPIAARMQHDGPMIVLAEGAAEHVYAILPPTSKSDRPKLLWRQPGRGMSDGTRHLGLLACDLDGDGGDELLTATHDLSGKAQLLAVRHDQSVLWTAEFDYTPGALPVWNIGALVFWWPGEFRNDKELDLFVNTRRGLMHSDVGHLLDGRTGQIIWTREKAIVPGQFDWGYAGIPPAITDLDGDGRDELISLYPVCFWVADGQTGQIKVGRELASQRQLPAWAAYGEPMLHTFRNTNQFDVLLDSPYLLALLDASGNPLWHGPGRPSYPSPGQTNHNSTATKHALIDLDGDGTFELASAGYGAHARAYDPSNGKLLWTLDAPAPTCPRVVAANIDGSPGDELLYVAGDTLIAITGNTQAGRILWQWQAPAALSMPIVADLDQDGLAEILVHGADGIIRCIDSAP